MQDPILLIAPAKAWKAQALAYRQEHFACGEPVIHGSQLLDQIEDYDGWLDRVIANAHPETVSPDWVLTDTFFAVRASDRTIVGIADLRYQLNDALKDLGHCGYSVRPTQRRKGYATQILAQLCQKAKGHGMASLQVSVERGNLPSIRTIVRNGGQYRRSFAYEGTTADLYSIDL